jgi:hypothetical protein
MRSRRPSFLEPFTWPRLNEGYTWSEGVVCDETGTAQERRSRCLVPKEIADARRCIANPVPQEAESYDPIAEDALFLKFAHLEPSEGGIVEFANRYGALGGVTDDLGVQVVLPNGMTTLGFPRNRWIQDVWEMRRAVRVWEALGYGETPHGEPNKKFLQDHIRIDRDRGKYPFAYYVNEPRPPEQPFPSYQAAELIYDGHPFFGYERTRAGNVKHPFVHAARLFLAHEINRKLDPYTFLRVEPEAKAGNLELRLVPSPKNLLGALWLGLARAVDRTRGYRRCRWCRTWFEISLEASRRSRFYCSDAHKQAAYHDRQRHARTLRQDGRSLGEIARTLHVDIDSVRCWTAGVAPRQRSGRRRRGRS